MSRSFLVFAAALCAAAAIGCEKKKTDAPAPAVTENAAMLTYADNADSLAPSLLPPAGIPVAKAPLFVAFGFDDNGVSGLDSSGTKGGLSFVTAMFAGLKNPAGSGNPATFDASPAHFSFYAAANYIAEEAYEGQSLVDVKHAWRNAVDAGNEIGCHTYAHNHGADSSEASWDGEMKKSLAWYFKPYDPAEFRGEPNHEKGIGIMPVQISGFRVPYLEYNDNAFSAMKKNGFLYDCSIEEGYGDNEDGTNFLWPYTLHNGAPGNKADTSLKQVGNHPGLWELPAYALIVPPDNLCEKYGATKGLRDRCAKIHPDYFDVEDGKITGLDWNLWCDFYLTKAEFIAVLKYSFDLRMQGNRAPFLFGCHSDIYSDRYEDSIPGATWTERQEALSEFLAWVSTKPEVRIVSMKNVVDWMRKPVALAAAEKK